MRPSFIALGLALCAVAVAVAGCGGSGGESAGGTTPAGGDTSATGSPPTPPTAGATGSTATAAPEGTLALGKVTAQVPKEWKTEPPAGQFRMAQFAIPAAPGDSAATQLLVFNFGGPGQGGSVDDNLKRWKDMMIQPGGKDAAKAAKVEKKEMGAVRVTTLDLSGTYKEKPFPMASEFTERPNYRMLAAVVENLKDNSEGAYFLRLVGPAKTVAAAKKGWDTLIVSLKGE